MKENDMKENALLFPVPWGTYSELTNSTYITHLEKKMSFTLSVPIEGSPEPQDFWVHYSRGAYLNLPDPTSADEIVGPIAVTLNDRWAAPLHKSFVQAIKEWRKVGVMKSRTKDLISKEQEIQATLNKSFEENCKLPYYDSCRKVDVYSQLTASALKENVYKYVLIQLEDYPFSEGRRNILHHLLALNSRANGGDKVTTLPNGRTFQEVSILVDVIEKFNLLEGI